MKGKGRRGRHFAGKSRSLHVWYRRMQSPVGFVDQGRRRRWRPQCDAWERWLVRRWFGKEVAN